MTINIDPKKHSVAGVRLSERAMLANIHVRGWAGERLDREITDQVNRDHGASSNAGKYTKNLIDDSFVKPLRNNGNAARNLLKFYGAPWGELAVALPALNYDAFMARYNELKQERDSLVRELQQAFINGDVEREARQRLNGMYDSTAYPTIEQIPQLFRMEIAIYPFPDSADFRLQHTDSDAIRVDIERQTRETIAESMSDTWQRIAVLVESMAEKLKAYKPASNGHKATGVFRDSIFDHMNDLVDILPGLNIASDPKLETIINVLRDHLTGLDGKQLRENDSARATTAAKAEKIQAAMSQFMA